MSDPLAASLGPRLAGKIALITGGSSGIGRATVDLFLLHGAKIVVLDRDAPALPFGENVVLHQGSVAEEAVWGQAIELSVATYGVTPNVLIQCAGVSGKSRIHECPLKEWEFTFSINATGVFLGMKAFIGPLIKGGRKGSIVNISSTAGLLGMKTGVSYEASKGACTQLSRSAAVDYAKDGIRVNSMHPGLIKTEMVLRANRPDSERKPWFDHTPMNRWGTPYEIATGLLFLASDEASFVTGLSFTADGGYTAM